MLCERKKRELFLFFCFILVPSISFAVDVQHFPTPPFLADNVLFWKKVYTDVSVNEGLLHDRNHPLIIYQRLKVGNRRGRTLDAYVESYKKRIANILRKLPTKPAHTQTEEEKFFLSMFKEYSSIRDIPQAISRIRFQRGQRESFLKGLEQSGMYIKEIFAIIKRENLPLRLAYLPHVESSFMIHAVSKAGAVGLWQFMPETGKQYLDIDRYIDERRDPVLSTEAAIQLLKQNYAELKSWPLAITAYNYGLGGIKRAVRKTGSRDISVIIQKHKSRSFQFASKNFYSCFLAACEIDENYRRYFKVVKMESPLLRKRFVMKNPTTPSEICQSLDISISAFKSLNPAFKPSLFKKNAIIPKHYTVFLPLNILEETTKDLFIKPSGYPQTDHSTIAQHQPPKTDTQSQPSKTDHRQASIKKPRYEKAVQKKLKTAKYRVKKGDSLWLIAKKLGIDDQKLRHMNGLSKRSYIHPGQIIKVPLTKKPLYHKPQKKSDPQKIAPINTSKKLPKKIVKNPKSLPKLDLKPAVPNNEKLGTRLWKKYTVKHGDTLWDIAREMNLSASQIKEINRLKKARLQPGQVLFIPQSAKPNPMMTKYHEQDHQEAIKRIRKLRKQQNQQLEIDYYYKVKPGDTLKTIAQQTGVSLELIALINHMTDDFRVYVGQVLRIPKKKKG